MFVLSNCSLLNGLDGVACSVGTRKHARMEEGMLPQCTVLRIRCGFGGRPGGG